MRRRRASSALVALSHRRRVHPPCGRGSFLSAPSRCSARRERVPCGSLTSCWCASFTACCCLGRLLWTSSFSASSPSGLLTAAIAPSMCHRPRPRFAVLLLPSGCCCRCFFVSRVWCQEHPGHPSKNAPSYSNAAWCSWVVAAHKVYELADIAHEVIYRLKEGKNMQKRN
jgi:hypothetical protein